MAQRRPDSLVSLLGDNSPPREDRPQDESWRADALARSRHSRLDRLPLPGEAWDPRNAIAVCGDIARQLLRDFAPALILLPASERQRFQVLLAYTRTLLDFADQHGVEGERLAQINRWEFALDACLAGEQARQPIFHLMAAEDGRRPWRRDALDDLGRIARQRVTKAPRQGNGAGDNHRALAVRFATAWLGTTPPAPVSELATRLLEVHRLDRGADRSSPASGHRTLKVDLQVAAEALPLLPASHRPAFAYAVLAAHRILSQLEEGATPRVGFWARIGLLLKARWMGRTRS